MANLYNFCFWDARSKHDTILILVNETFVTSILVIALLRLPALLRLWKLGIEIDVKKIVMVHGLVIAWATTQSAVNYYSIVVYLSLPHEQTASEMIEHSYRYTLLNAFPGSLVQTLFLTICATFCRNMVCEMDIRLFSPGAFRFVQGVRLYCWARLLPWAAILALEAAASYEQIGLLLRADTIYVMADSAVINVFLLLSMRIFILRLRHANYGRLKTEYWTMFFCSVARITIDGIFLGLFLLEEQEEGPCLSDGSASVAYTVLYNGLQSYLMHIIPVALILKIYKFDRRRMSEELLPRTEQDVSNSQSGSAGRREFRQ